MRDLNTQLDELLQLPGNRFTASTAAPFAFKLLLLDFDGTLVDTRDANFRAYAATLREQGRELSAKEYFERYFGMRCTEFMAAVGFDDPTSQECLRRRKIALYPSFFETVRLNEPLWDFAQAFRKAGGKVWIVSTGSRPNIENVMRHLKIEKQVDGILTGDDIERSKPAPDCFLKVMRTEGVTPSQTLIFEDSIIGLEAACRSGATYVAVRL